MSKARNSDEGPDLSRDATLERLQVWLERHYGPAKENPADRHGPHDANDLQILEHQPGWLWESKECRCACPPYDGAPMHYPAGYPHHHTFYVRGVLTRMYDTLGHHGPLTFWKYLRDHQYLPVRDL